METTHPGKTHRLPGVSHAFGVFRAERAGFEPAVGFNPYAALAKRCFRPLSHLSDTAGPRHGLILAPPPGRDNAPRRPAHLDRLPGRRYDKQLTDLAEYYPDPRPAER